VPTVKTEILKKKYEYMREMLMQLKIKIDTLKKKDENEGRKYFLKNGAAHFRFS